jgi:5-methyltetrahydrofolate--homocysteine methyltransferase
MIIATVKGDVHDIGKNIVAVVLACNNWEVEDLGVMVSCEKILQAAKEKNADVIGLSGLITPSLDEMASNAAEMKRQGFNIPLLIGGATTSKAHTAIKLAPHYNQPVVQVPDASLVVNVCNELTNPEKKKDFVESLSKKQAELREKHATANGPKLLSLKEARSRRFSTDWSSERIEKPTENRLGVSVFEEVSLETVVEYFDWSPFFWSWELKGTFPDIFQKGDLGKEAQSLYDDGRKMLDQIISEKHFQCRAAVGLWRANSIGDDVELYDGKSRGSTLATFRFLRRQQEILSKKTQYCLADYIAPKSSGITDYLGGFAVTAGSGVETFAKTFQDAGDDYSSIIVKALGDRFAEAMAEYMHHKIRCWWGFGEKENLDNDARIAEKYQGIRPAAGYPCQPDHTEKDTLWNILDAEQSTGVQLTESRAMNPGSSVCGLYFSNPKANYFNLGRINQDQVKDYAARKDWTVAEAEKWLRPNLAS